MGKTVYFCVEYCSVWHLNVQLIFSDALYTYRVVGKRTDIRLQNVPSNYYVFEADIISQVRALFRFRLNRFERAH